MKKKISNKIFWSYLALILIFGIVILSYFKIKLKDYVQTDNSLIHVNVETDVKYKVPDFSCIIIKNNSSVSLVEADSCAADVTADKLRYSGDTLFVENDKDISLTFKNLKEINIRDQSELNLVTLKTPVISINASNDASANLVLVNTEQVNLKAIDNATFNLVSKGIEDLNIDFQGSNTLNITGRVQNLKGYFSKNSTLTSFPKPKKIDLKGNGTFN